MSDTSYAVFQHYGTAAQRAAFTPSPAATGQPIYIWYETDTGSVYLYDTSWHFVSGSTAASGPIIPAARLTTETGVPVSTSDRTAQGTIYWTPYNGNQIRLYSGATWVQFTLTEKSLALTATSGKNYDVFAYNNAGTVTLELSAAWTTDTARADALALQDGVYVKSGATTRLWIGTIRASGANVTADAAASRFVWNAYNQVRRQMVNATETTNQWDYTTASFRQANANAANQLAYVTGDAASLVDARVYAMMTNTNTGIGATAGVGVDSTTVNSAQYHGTNTGGTSGIVVVQHATYIGTPGLGYHFLAWLEYSNATGTATWFGDAGSATLFQSGIMGTVWN